MEPVDRRRRDPRPATSALITRLDWPPSGCGRSPHGRAPARAATHRCRSAPRISPALPRWPARQGRLRIGQVDALARAGRRSSVGSVVLRSRTASPATRQGRVAAPVQVWPAMRACSVRAVDLRMAFGITGEATASMPWRSTTPVASNARALSNGPTGRGVSPPSSKICDDPRLFRYAPQEIARLGEARQAAARRHAAPGRNRRAAAARRQPPCRDSRRSAGS